MTSAVGVLREAASCDGYVEGAGNVTRFGEWYGANGAPWCAMFVSYCYFRAGLPLPATTTQGFAYCPSGAAWFREIPGLWRRPVDPIEPGFVVFYHFPNTARIGHVGIVDEVLADGTFHAWEGNTDVRGGRTGGRVIRQHRSRASVGRQGGFGVPLFDEPNAPSFPGRILTVDTPLLRGPDVSCWQERMRGLGWEIDVDGLYGKQSAAVCSEFQAQRGLQGDGAVGPQTWEAAWNAPLPGSPAAGAPSAGNGHE